MDYLRQIEEDLRNIGIESKLNKKYPEVSDASERALDALKSIREVYVSDIMKKNKSAKLPQSSDILAPYLLVCNYADGSTKVTLMALKGMHLLLTYDLVPPSDVKNIMRVLNIQGTSKVVDVQLKVLQVVLQLANSLNQNAETTQHLTESTFCSFLTLAMQMCDTSSKNSVIAVSTTALGTARQIVAQVMEGAHALFPLLNGESKCASGNRVLEVSVDQASSKYSLTAIMLVREMCLFVQGMPGDWIRGVTMPQAFALDLLTEILTDSKVLFQCVPFFRKLVQDSVFPAIKQLLKGLQEDYLRHAQQSGAVAAASFTSKVVKLARCILINFVVAAAANPTAGDAASLNAEGAFIISMLVHSLQPDRAGPGHGGHLLGEEAGAVGGGGSGSGVAAESTFKSRWEEASSFLGGGLLSRFSTPAAAGGASSSSSGGGGGLSGHRSASGKGNSSSTGGSGSGFYVTLPPSPGGAGGALPVNSSSASALLSAAGAAGQAWMGSTSGATQLPTFPALCCMEALLAFLLSDLSPLLTLCGAPAQQHPGSQGAIGASPSKSGNEHGHYSSPPKLGSNLHLFETLLVSTMLGVTTFLQSAMISENNLRELEGSLKAATPLSKLLKSILNGTYQHDNGSASGADDCAGDSVNGSEKHVKGIHELLHGAPNSSTAPGDLFLLAFYLTQFVPRVLLTVSIQTCACGEHGHKMLRRSNSNGSNATHRVFLSSSVANLVAPTASSARKGPSSAPVGAAAVVGLIEMLRADPARGQVLRDSVGRVCDSIYESSLDACSMLLNSAGDATVVRSSLGVVAELAIVTGIMELPRQCDIITSVLCKYTVPMWHGQEMLNFSLSGAEFGSGGQQDADSVAATPRGGAGKRESLIKWRHFQAFVRLSQVIHLIADAISDWDNIVDSFEQLVDYFICCRSPTLQLSTGGAGGAGPASPSSGNFSDKELSFPEVEKIFGCIERFKAYSVFLSDDALVRLMTSLVALSMNHLAVNASSHMSSSSNLDGGDNGEGFANSDIIQVNNSPFMSGAGQSGAAGGGSSSSTGVAGGSGGISRVRPDSSSAGLAYMSEGIRNGTISFSLQALIEITKLNAFRISTVWQMVISHLRMIASLKSANSRAISVAATHDVILSSMRYMQQGTKPAAGIIFLQEDFAQVSQVLSVGPDGVSSSSWSSLLFMSDEVLFNFILPTSETAFVGRDIHRSALDGRDDRLSNRPALSQNDLLSSLKALSSVRYSDVRSGIIDGLANLLQGKGQIVSGGGAGGWAVILDLISSVPLSMASAPAASESEQAAWATTNGEEGWDAEESFAGLDAGAQSTLPPTPVASADTSVRLALQVPGFQGSGSMASLATAGVIPQYQWPLESLVSAFTCMKLIVDEFLVVLEPDCELVSSVLHGLALFGSQVKDVNISLTSVEMLWKVTDDAIKYARSNAILRLSGKTIATAHYVAVIFDIMLKQLFQLSMDGQPLIRHCAMNTLFSAMSTHAPIISTEQWQQVFGNIIFPLFERAGARSRIAMKSKEEAIAPELKKGVKMSVHHSRDTAHKQWSETRVIALRGLSRVLRTCTRLLLQESWFRVIWADALNVCQGALQAANEEQEVSIAALDVVFTMLRVIIQMDSTGPAATPAEAAAPLPSTTSSRGNSKSAASAAAPVPAALSKDEVENIEKCKLTLWQLTWISVRNTAFFTCNSVELALAICQKLKELYKSRIDHEFRYSDNVRVLLEILVALVRPRVGLLRGNAALASSALPDLITQKQDRVAESQLQRSVIDLLTVIQPTDGLSQSCLMSTLTEICFSVLWVQVQVSAQGESDSGKGAELEWLVLGAAPERLRKEAADLLAQLLLSQFSPVNASSSPSSAIPALAGETEQVVVVTKVPSKVFPWATASTQMNALMVDIVVRRFVADICEGPLLSRWQAHLDQESSALTEVARSAQTPSAASVRERKSRAVDSKKHEEAQAGFFASLGSIMSSFSSPSTQNLQPVYASHGAATSEPGPPGMLPHLQSARIAGGTLHKFVKYTTALEAKSLPDCTPAALCHSNFEGGAGAEWRTFYFADTEIKLLLTAVQSCYTLMSAPSSDARHPHSKQATSPGGGGNRSAAHHAPDIAAGSSPPGREMMTEPIWNSLLTATACLLSPWKSSELCSKAASASSPVAVLAASGAAGGDMAPLPAVHIANILKVTLKIIDFMRYPASMTLQWVDILVRSTLLGLHVLAQSLRATQSPQPPAVGDFYMTLWQQVVSVLGSLLAAEEDAALVVRSRALWGVVEIARSAIGAVILMEQAEEVAAPSALHQICEETLRLFLRVSTGPQLVSATGADLITLQADLTNIKGGEDQLITAWMMSSKIQPILFASGVAGVDKTSNKRRSIPSKEEPESATAEEDAKSHLSMLLPMCLNLVLAPCNFPSLKEVAVSLIRAVDLNKLTSRVHVLELENTQLRVRNKQLEKEIVVLQSANTLPF